MPEDVKYYLVNGKRILLRRVKTVRYVSIERNYHTSHVAARLARSSRLAINPGVPKEQLVVRGDPKKLEIIKDYEDIYCTRSAFTDPDGHEIILTDEILVGFSKSLKKSERQDLVRKHNCVVIDDSSDIWRLRVLSREDDAPLDISNKISEENGVEFSEPNALQSARYESASPPSDDRFNDQWHLHNTGQGGGTQGADINALEAWAHGYGSSNIGVVIHDTGVDITHPDLSANVGSGWDFDNNDSNASNDDDAHGTACAGVVAATRDDLGVVGIAPSCTIIPLRAAGAHTWDTWKKTFEWAAQHGDIISCSWTIPESNILSAAIRNVVNDGIPVFCATGNDSRDSIGYPASMPETIAVGASTNQDIRSGYSNYGNGLDFVAPSSGGTRRIETTDIQGDEGYNSNIGTAGDYCEAEDPTGFGGTSSATPLAAGVAALMLSVNGNLTPDDIKRILKDTAVKIDTDNVTYDANGWNSEYGYGRIDAGSAVQAATAEALPDLVIDSLSHSPHTPNTEDEITFTVVVKNSGSGPATPSTLIVKVGGETYGKEYPVPELGVGDTYTVQRKEVLGVAQNYRNTITVDSNNDVLESNEDNNIMTYDYKVVTVSTLSYKTGQEAPVSGEYRCEQCEAAGTINDLPLAEDDNFPPCSTCMAASRHGGSRYRLVRISA